MGLMEHCPGRDHRGLSEGGHACDTLEGNTDKRRRDRDWGQEVEPNSTWGEKRSSRGAVRAWSPLVTPLFPRTLRGSKGR